ncbi:MAG TPA: hypothetical protein VGN72_22885 [Tepidisphaeraceae bacterium]|jgi:ABC-type Fe3+ transport system permease subunit|nr:hypothetical protein [Tepidisphaeraceae bacterium]
MIARLPRIIVAVLVALCCGLPTAWVLWQIATHPAALGEIVGDQFRLLLLARTVGYNAIAAIVAVLLATPVAIVLGRRRGPLVALMWAVLPGSLLIPSIVYSYGWSQFLWIVNSYGWSRFFGLSDVKLNPGSTADIARCIWSLAAWLWPIPAGLMGLALRRLDGNLQQQAVMDGVLGRVTLRLLWPTIASALAIVLVLAMQEFAVYEQTGISVIATEVRTVFDTGGVMALLGADAWQPGGVQSAGFSGADQASRAAAAIVTGAPLVLAVAFLSGIALWGLSRFSNDTEVDVGPLPAVLRASWRWIVPAVAVLLIVIAVPVGALVLSHSAARSVAFIWNEFQPQVTGTLLIAGLAALFASAAALLACSGRQRIVLILAIAAFLIGGQFIAIALIRIYNRPWLQWAYDGVPIMIIAYLARFVWIALLAARGTTGPAYQPLRDMAAVDGATPWQATVAIIWPIAWPTLLAAGVLVGVLAMGEVPATTLLSPLRPPMLVPSLMTWVHTVRFDPMIEASLLLAGLAIGVGAVVAMLVWLGQRNRAWRVRK